MKYKKIKLKFIKEYSFSDTWSSLFFKLSLENRIFERYKNQAGDTAFIFYLLSDAAVASLFFEYMRKYGIISVPFVKSVDPPWEVKNGYKFRIDFRKVFLEKKKLEEITFDLGKNIENIINTYVDIFDLLEEHTKLLPYINSLKSNTMLSFS